MRIPMNNISPLMLFWCMVYVLALLSIYTAGILVLIQGAKRSPARNQIRSNHPNNHWKDSANQ